MYRSSDISNLDRKRKEQATEKRGLSSKITKEKNDWLRNEKRRNDQSKKEGAIDLE